MSTSEDKCVTKISNVLFQKEELLAQKEALDKKKYVNLDETIELFVSEKNKLHV